MRIHTTQQGDTLWALSQRYQIPLESIFSANGLQANSPLVIGQAVIIPGPPGDAIHKVAAGESLWSIGQKYGLTIKELQQANQLHNPALIQIGQELLIPSRSKPVIEVNAYIEKFGETGQAIADEVGPLLTYLSPFSSRIKENGSFTELDDQAVISSAYTFRTAPMMVITNFDNGKFNSQTAHIILNNNELQQQLIPQIIAVMKDSGYEALNVDFEYILPQDREAYNYFLEKLADELHKHQFLLSTAIAPKLSTDQQGTLYEAHDYAAHGKIVDFVIIMTYEWGWSGGPPRAVAPINEVAKVLNYALGEIPANKIMMGMPLYGYDWTLPYVQGGKWAQAISPQEAVKRAAEYHAEINYDTRSQAPYYHYYDRQGIEHVVWFEDARSVQAKFDLVKSFQLRGISYWVLGLPFQQNWYALEENFTVKKL